MPPRPVPAPVTARPMTGRPVHQHCVRMLAAFPLALVAGAVLTACSVGVEAGTLDAVSLTQARADVGQIKIRNAIVVAPAEEGDGSAVLSVTIVNDGTTEDALVGLELSGADGPVPVTLAPRTVELPPETATTIPGDTGATATATATADVSTIEIGTYTTARFSFANAGSVELDLLVVAPVGWWAEVADLASDADG